MGRFLTVVLLSTACLVAVAAACGEADEGPTNQTPSPTDAVTSDSHIIPPDVLPEIGPVDAAPELNLPEVEPPDLPGVPLADLAPDTVQETMTIEVQDISDPGCDPEVGCPQGVCDPETLLCVGCLSDEDCLEDHYCDALVCMPDICVQGTKQCANELTAVQCNENGSKSEFVVCEDPDVCAWGECALPLCEPYSKWCTDDYYIAVCDGTGTAVQQVTCPPGFACYDGFCNPIRHNVFVVFDTSGSMYDSVNCDWSGPFCEQDWPICEKPNAIFSLLGKCKKAFATVFAEQQQGTKVNFALFRFPQSVSSSNPDCTSGHFASKNKMTGDGGQHVSPEGPDSWFEKNMHEVVAVPFPATADGGNLDDCLLWVDFWEELLPDETSPCTGSAECPGGVCKNLPVVGKVCHFHTNPELRADGWTPLGRTMFYAGEYVRKFAVVEGKPCEADADCGNANYRCNTDGTCADPLRHCRENVMLLFTDGEETEANSISSFYHPVVQAKRFRYGLGCASDDDCIDDATCGPSDYCLPPDVLGVPWYQDSAGANILPDYNGDAIKLTVHVVHAGDAPLANQEIATNGGGDYYPVDANDMDELVGTLQTIIDIKANLEICIPGGDGG